MVLGVVAMMVVPLPSLLVDLLLAANVALAVLLLLSAMNAERVLDLASFPSILLLATLFRLGLNVSTTRMILSTGDAGSVITSFGRSVVSGSLVVGLVVFFILVVIQFVVITNGSARVSEVAARFTLDAMPGKQMAIDADLNAGMITETEARQRREDIAAEADFFGAMDGSSKFVKGDAIAGIIITTVNLIGGLAIGMTTFGLSAGNALGKFAMLTIGDGLVSQIPALLISIAAGIIVTRSSVTGSDLGSSISVEFTKQARAFQIGGGALMALGAIPGLPLIPFVFIGLMLIVVGSRLAARPVEVILEEATELIEVDPDDPDVLARTMRVEPIGLELATDMLDLVDPSRGGDLLDRVRGLRRKIAMDLGFVLPAVRTRDNVDLPSGTYTISFHGVELARGTAPAGQFLIIDDDLARWPGEEFTEPVFGIPVKWVPESVRSIAESSGATAVDRASVITTHVMEIIHRHGSDLLARQDVRDLLEQIRETDPAVVEDLASADIPLPQVQWILQDLLSEQVSIRDVVRIVEQISAFGRVSTDPTELSEHVREALAPAICGKYLNADGELATINLDPALESELLAALTSEGASTSLDAEALQVVLSNVVEVAQEAENMGNNPVLLCAPKLRRPLVTLLAQLKAAPPVLSYREVGSQAIVVTVGAVSLPGDRSGRQLEDGIG